MIFEAAKQGLSLWAGQLFPALFPFLILSNLFLAYLSGPGASFPLKHLPKKQILGLSPMGLYTLFMGHFCGYPMGAKITADLYTQGRISRGEATYLLMIANQASPAFISSYLASYALGKPGLTPCIFLIFYSSTILTALLVRYIFPFSSKTDRKQTVSAWEKTSFIQKLDYGIVDAFSTLVRVGGYVTLFAILGGLLTEYLPLPQTARAALLAFLEMTNGLPVLADLQMSPSWSFCVLLACVAFGGLSTMAQIKGMLIGTSLSLKPYIIGKCIYTLIVFLLARLISIQVIFIQLQ